MLRWVSVLCLLTLGTGLLVLGVIPVGAVGLARILLGAYAALLAVTAVVGVVRG